MVPAAAVRAFCDWADELGVTYWIDGGWGVDALLGEQTRPHGDLDLALDEAAAAVLVPALRARGFVEVELDRPGRSEWSFVLADVHGHELDLHIVRWDADGNGVLGPPEDGSAYPVGALTGTGTIAGRAVRCVEPGWMVRFHTGYAVDAQDWADVSRLCARFDLPIPGEYAEFRDRA
jgi:lincosamide nucleotidyltransferase A/C/D/E